jgi:uncharacterized membrane protein
MRSFTLIAAAALLLGACGSREKAPEHAPRTPDARSAAAPNAPNRPTGRWELQSSGEGTALALLSADGRAIVRLFCPAGANRLVVNVAGFRPIGSEERLSFGSGGAVTALVADPRGDAQRGGVSGSGAVPAELPGLVGGPVSVSYGAQTSGPHPAPPPDLSRAFLAACREGSAAARPPIGPAAAAASPCLIQGSERLRVTPIRAVGTEPFWAARIEGRCVTYSHPEDQAGTRIWTRYAPGPDGGTWTGAVGGESFELRTHARPGCSDGMSDKSYPIAVELTVHGERRRGCAEPL